MPHYPCRQPLCQHPKAAVINVYFHPGRAGGRQRGGMSIVRGHGPTLPPWGTKDSGVKSERARNWGCQGHGCPAIHQSPFPFCQPCFGGVGKGCLWGRVKRRGSGRLRAQDACEAARHSPSLRGARQDSVPVPPWAPATSPGPVSCTAEGSWVAWLCACGHQCASSGIHPAPTPPRPSSRGWPHPWEREDAATEDPPHRWRQRPRVSPN